MLRCQSVDTDELVYPGVASYRSLRAFRRSWRPTATRCLTVVRRVASRYGRVHMCSGKVTNPQASLQVTARTVRLMSDILSYASAVCVLMQTVLAAVPERVDNVIFPNYESLPEQDDVKDPFTEVRPRCPQGNRSKPVRTTSQFLCRMT